MKSSCVAGWSAFVMCEDFDSCLCLVSICSNKGERHVDQLRSLWSRDFSSAEACPKCGHPTPVALSKQEASSNELKVAGYALQFAGIAFFLYWNFSVAGTMLYQGDWRYTYNDLPGSMWYPLVPIFVGSYMVTKSKGETE